MKKHLAVLAGGGSYLAIHAARIPPAGHRADCAGQRHAHEMASRSVASLFAAVLRGMQQAGH